MRKTLTISMAVAVVAASCSLALAKTSDELSETASGTVAFGASSSVTLTGTAVGTPIKGAFAAVLAATPSVPPGATCMYGGSVVTGTVTLGSGANKLVKNETGVVCLPGPMPTPVTKSSFTLRYKIDPVASTGSYKGATGAGTAKYTFTAGPSSGVPTRFTSVETGTLELVQKPAAPGPGETKPKNKG